MSDKEFAPGRLVPPYQLDLTPEIQAALAALADVETEYEVKREALEQSGSDPGKEQLLEALEESHRAERAPLVQRLGDLQQAMTFAMMVRDLQTKLHGPAGPEAAPAELPPKVRSAVVALSDIEQRFAREHEYLAGWQGPTPAKARLLRELQVRYSKDKETALQRVAQLSGYTSRLPGSHPTR